MDETDECWCGHTFSQHETPGTECSVIDCPCLYFREPPESAELSDDELDESDLGCR